MCIYKPILISIYLSLSIYIYTYLGPKLVTLKSSLSRVVGSILAPLWLYLADFSTHLKRIWIHLGSMWASSWTQKRHPKSTLINVTLLAPAWLHLGCIFPTILYASYLDIIQDRLYSHWVIPVKPLIHPHLLRHNAYLEINSEIGQNSCIRSVCCPFAERSPTWCYRG